MIRQHVIGLLIQCPHIGLEEILHTAADSGAACSCPDHGQLQAPINCKLTSHLSALQATHQDWCSCQLGQQMWVAKVFQNLGTLALMLTTGHFKMRWGPDVCRMDLHSAWCSISVVHTLCVALLECVHLKASSHTIILSSERLSHDKICCMPGMYGISWAGLHIRCS